MPKLSICIPTRDRAERLATCLSRLSDFQFKDFEVVISDNASSDDTAAVVERFRGQLPNVYYFRQETALNRFQSQLPAFNLASGEYLAYLADDDFLIEEGLLKALDLLESNPDVSVVIGAWLEVRDEDGSIQAVKQNESAHGRRSLDNLHEIIHNIDAVEMPIMRREAYRKAVMPFQYQLSFDFFGMTNLMKMGDVVFIEDPIYGVVQHDGQGSNQLFEDEHLSSYLADYELTAITLPNLSPRQRQLFIAQRIVHQYVAAAQTACRQGMFLLGRNLIVRALAYGVGEADGFAMFMDKELRTQIVVQTIIVSMRTSGSTDLLVVEDHERTRPIANFYRSSLPEANLTIATGDELSQMPYGGREYFLYVDPELLRSRENISEGPIRRSAQVDELLNLCKILA